MGEDTQDARLVWMAVTRIITPTPCHFLISTTGNCPKCNDPVLGPPSDHYTLIVDVAGKDKLSDAMVALQAEIKTADYVPCSACAPEKPGPAQRKNTYGTPKSHQLLVISFNADKVTEQPFKLELDNFTFNQKEYTVIAAVQFIPGTINHWAAWLRNRSTWWVCLDSETVEEKEMPPGLFSLVVAYRCP